MSLPEGCTCFIIPPLTVIVEQLAKSCDNYIFTYVDVSKVSCFYSLYIFQKLYHFFCQEHVETLFDKLVSGSKVILCSMECLSDIKGIINLHLSMIFLIPLVLLNSECNVWISQYLHFLLFESPGLLEQSGLQKWTYSTNYLPG